jgi:hypothetical protein
VGSSGTITPEMKPTVEVGGEKPSVPVTGTGLLAGLLTVTALPGETLIMRGTDSGSGLAMLTLGLAFGFWAALLYEAINTHVTATTRKSTVPTTETLNLFNVTLLLEIPRYWISEDIRM